MKKLLTLTSLLVTLFANAQLIQITNPFGGMAWNNGHTWTIKWTSGGVSKVNIDYSTDGGANWTNIVSDLTNTGNYNWAMAGVKPTAQGRIRVMSTAQPLVGDTTGHMWFGPYLLVYAIDTIICKGTLGKLFAGTYLYTSDGGPPPPPGSYTYHWASDLTLDSPTIATPNVNPTVTTTYYVTAWDDQGDTGSTQVTVKVSDMHINYENHMDGVFPDSIIVHVTGGQYVNSYKWNNSNSSTDSIFLVNSSGIYTVTVSDAKCKATGYADTIGYIAHPDTFIIPSKVTSDLQVEINDWWRTPWLAVDITIVTPPLHGSAQANGENGVDYSPGSYVGTDSFTYSSCDYGTHYCDTAVVYLTVIDSVIVEITKVKFASCDSLCDGGIEFTVNGGQPNYTYNLVGPHGFTSNNPFLNNLCPGNFTLAVIDGLGRVGYAQFKILSNASLSLHVASDTLNASVFQRFQNDKWKFNWSTGQVDSSIDNTSHLIATKLTTYCVTATDDNSGCQMSNCATVSCNNCVWPGDANYDGIVDNYDLLPIGLAYDSTGIQRSNATLDWYGQPCLDWTSAFNNSVNYKHADCDGSGIINADDTIAILHNFSLVHPRSGKSPRKDDVPPLLISFSPDTVNTGDILTATVTLGTPALPATNVYGIAFTVNYDIKIVDTAKTSVRVSDSWLGTSTDRISIAKDLKQGQIKMGLTRIDHATRSGNGPIGIITFVITTDNINGKNLSYYGIHGWISDVRAVDALGNAIDLSEGEDEATLEYTATGIKEVQDLLQRIAVFPNPANEQITITAPVGLQASEVRITDIIGNTLLKHPAFTGSIQLNVSLLEGGAYFVEVTTPAGISTRKLVIER